MLLGWINTMKRARLVTEKEDWNMNPPIRKHPRTNSYVPSSCPVEVDGQPKPSNQHGSTNQPKPWRGKEPPDPKVIHKLIKVLAKLSETKFKEAITKVPPEAQWALLNAVHLPQESKKKRKRPSNKARPFAAFYKAISASMLIRRQWLSGREVFQQKIVGVPNLSIAQHEEAMKVQSGWGQIDPLSVALSYSKRTRQIASDGPLFTFTPTLIQGRKWQQLFSHWQVHRNSELFRVQNLTTWSAFVKYCRGGSTKQILRLRKFYDCYQYYPNIALIDCASPTEFIRHMERFLKEMEDEDEAWNWRE